MVIISCVVRLLLLLLPLLTASFASFTWQKHFLSSISVCPFLPLICMKTCFRNKDCKGSREKTFNSHLVNGSQHCAMHHRQFCPHDFKSQDTYVSPYFERSQNSQVSLSLRWSSALSSLTTELETEKTTMMCTRSLFLVRIPLMPFIFEGKFACRLSNSFFFTRNHRRWEKRENERLLPLTMIIIIITNAVVVILPFHHFSLRVCQQWKRRREELTVDWTLFPSSDIHIV